MNVKNVQYINYNVQKIVLKFRGIYLPFDTYLNWIWIWIELELNWQAEGKYTMVVLRISIAAVALVASVLAISINSIYGLSWEIYI